jgi:hypothetical protein
MASFETLGRLHEIYGEVQVTEKFRKREFVLEITSGMYTDFVKFQLVQDRCSALNSFRVGDTVKVYFNLSGRKGTAKDGSTVYFTNLAAWKLEPSDGVVGAAGGATANNQSANRPAAATPPPSNEAPPPDDDDIPF